MLAEAISVSRQGDIIKLCVDGALNERLIISLRADLAKAIITELKVFSAEVDAIQRYSCRVPFTLGTVHFIQDGDMLYIYDGDEKESFIQKQVNDKYSIEENVKTFLKYVAQKRKWTFGEFTMWGDVSDTPRAVPFTRTELDDVYNEYTTMRGYSKAFSTRGISVEMMLVMMG